MVEIVAGELRRNETNKNAMGGTEMIAAEMHKRIDPKILKNWQIIHSRARGLEANLKHMLVCHDLPGDPEVQHLKDGGWEQYDKIVFVSNWQMMMYNIYLGVPYSHCAVICNAIDPIDVVPEDKHDGEKIRLIYHTTPHRGLNLLYAAFAELAKSNKNIELDVYSSFKIYGWEERDKPFEKLFQLCKEHPQINYHGSVPNSEVREALKKTNIFAYPSIWQETSCIALIEAMSAGCHCLIPNYGALWETGGGAVYSYQWDEDPNRHAVKFASFLEQVIENISSSEESFLFNHSSKRRADDIYTWERRIPHWETLLKI